MTLQWPYRVPDACHQAIEEEVNKILQDGIFKESISPWSSLPGECHDPLLHVVTPLAPSERGPGRILLTAYPRKCHLWLIKAQVLGYCTSQGLLKPQEKKIKAVKEYPWPTSKWQVSAFLRFAGYYWRFCAYILLFSLPLSDLTRKGQPNNICWSEEAEQMFHALTAPEEPQIRAPLHYPHRCARDEPGHHALLEFEGEDHPITYMRRKLTSTKGQYAVVE